MRKWSLLIISILILVIVYNFFTIDRSIIGVTSIRFMKCEMNIYDKALIPTLTLTILCPGQDTMRIWPLPFVKPWWEKEEFYPYDSYQT